MGAEARLACCPQVMCLKPGHSACIQDCGIQFLKAVTHRDWLIVSCVTSATLLKDGQHQDSGTVSRNFTGCWYQTGTTLKDKIQQMSEVTRQVPASTSSGNGSSSSSADNSAYLSNSVGHPLMPLALYFLTTMYIVLHDHEVTEISISNPDRSHGVQLGSGMDQPPKPADSYDS